MSENTPTTEEVRLAYAASRDDRDMVKYRNDQNAAIAEWDRIRDESYEWFDRWLAKHDAELLRKHADFLLARADLGGWSFAARAAEYLYKEAAGIGGVVIDG